MAASSQPQISIGGGGGSLGPAPDLMASAEQQRQRAMLRARLFGDEPQPTRLGRFVLLHRVGVGGMGAVYAAYDEQLDRKVALKILRPGAEGHDAQRRLLREAQAQAKLSHPNVVAVHEVGVHDDQPFIAMEFVAGRTLRAWQHERVRALAEVLSAYRQAGEGLRAAHEQGLVHRDFKPENVMISDDGRVRVLDFGLARWAPSDGPPGPAGGSSSHPETLQGTIAGTPVYMAPEQHEGGPVDARTDQFAFCVALYEALYKERPFEGDTLAKLRSSVAQGEVRPPPRGAAVPGWLRAALLRGLQPRPDERWPSMAALLAALGADPAAWRRRALGVVTLVLVVAAATTASVRWSARPSCDGAAPRVAEVWGGPQRQAVREALLRSGLGHAGQTWERVEAGLDRYSASWASMHQQACLAHRRGEQSPELLDLRMACLERRRGELRALVNVLSDRSERPLVDQAVQAVDALEPLDACADPVRLQAQVKPPRDAQQAASVEQLRAQLAAVKADRDAGLHRRGAAAARKLAEQAQKLGYAPLTAEALLLGGSLETLLNHGPRASEMLEASLVSALASGVDATAAEAALGLMELHTARHQSQLFWISREWPKVAEAMVERLVERTELKARFLTTRGTMHLESSRLDLAEGDLRQAMATLETLHGPRHPAIASQLRKLAQVADKRGRHDEQLALLRRELAILEERLGQNHPQVTETLREMAASLRKQGRNDEARDLLHRALAIEELVAGERSERLFQTLVRLAGLLGSMQQRDEAMVFYRRAASVVGADPEDDINLRLVRVLSLGSAMISLQHGADAEALAEQQIALLKPRVGPDHSDIGLLLTLQGRALVSLGRDDEASARFRQALALFEKVSPSSERIALPLIGLGSIALRRGDRTAVELLERALALRNPSLKPTQVRAEASFLLARALSPPQRQRALALAAQALADYRALGEEYETQVAEVKAWLDTPQPP